MEVLWKAEDLLCDKIEEVIQQGDISPTEMDNIYKAIKSLYYIEATCAMIEAGDDDYVDNNSFENMNSSRRGNGRRRSSYASYASYAQGQGGGGSSNRSSMARGRSYAGRGYSTHDKKEMMLQKIAEMEREIENMD